MDELDLCVGPHLFVVLRADHRNLEGVGGVVDRVGLEEEGVVVHQGMMRSMGRPRKVEGPVEDLGVDSAHS